MTSTQSAKQFAQPVEWATKSATDHAEAISRGEVTSSELVEYYIKRILVFDGKVNAVVVRCFDAARARAAEADAATAQGLCWGALHGVPITIKECFWMKDTLSTCAFELCIDFVATSNAPVVQRLLDAGAVVLGKTNVPVAAADVQTYNDKYGTTNNPWDPTRGPGGSSGGSAASMAAGFAALELGSDIGGSIRNPCHFCGVCGHKPTHGVVPLHGHAPFSPNHPAVEPNPTFPWQPATDPTFGHGLPVAGPIARSCDDLELTMRAIAGPEPYMAAAGFTLTLPPPRVTVARVGELRVACWLDEPAFAPVEAECVGLMRAAAMALKGAGAHVDFGARPAAPFSFEASYAAYRRLLHTWTQPGAPEVRALRHEESVAGSAKRWEVKKAWIDFFGSGFDVLLCPTMPATAFPHDHSPDVRQRTLEVNGEKVDYLDACLKWNGLVIFSDLPSTVVPVGRDRNNLPFGMQVVAAPWQDLQAIEVGKMLERLGFKYEAPPGYSDSDADTSHH